MSKRADETFALYFAGVRYIALLRAINVGGHTVKMDHLRGLFEALKFRNVETFIASGNVVFDASSKDAAALERRIERHLASSLGYEVATFLRTLPEISAISTHAPYPFFATVEAGHSFSVGFLRSAPHRDVAARIAQNSDAMNVFHVHDRELYWYARSRMSDSTFSPGAFEKSLGVQATFRNINTVRRLAARYA